MADNQRAAVLFDTMTSATQLSFFLPIPPPSLLLAPCLFTPLFCTEFGHTKTIFNIDIYLRFCFYGCFKNTADFLKNSRKKALTAINYAL